MTGHTATPRHPSVLHALSTAWALRAARHRLDTAVQAEAAALEAERDALAASDGLRSTQWSTGRGKGGHGDPVGTAALARSAPTIRSGRLAQLAASTAGTLTWLADTLRAPAGPDPIWRLIDAVPRLQPGTAATVTKWLTEADDRIRLALGMEPDEQLLPGAECPACGRRPLYARIAAPDPADWTVVCGACRCTGDGCGCGMPIRVEGVAHIWDRATLALTQEMAWPQRYVVGAGHAGVDGGEAA